LLANMVNLSVSNMFYMMKVLSIYGAPEL